MSLDDFYFAINDVRPSLIRVEADEATYNLHILVRFELEQALLLDELRVADLPGAWHEKYRQYLGIESPTDADGVLQDVHWSAGLVGYFPTYSLGNLYAAQLFDPGGTGIGRPGRDVPPRRVPALARLAPHARPRAGPALRAGRTGPPDHGREHFPRAADAAPARQVGAAVRAVRSRPCGLYRLRRETGSGDRANQIDFSRTALGRRERPEVNF